MTAGSNRKRSRPDTRTGLRRPWSRASMSPAAAMRDSREGEGHARHTLVEHEHKDSVARNVLPVHVGGDAHGGLGVAHGPQQGGAAVVDGDEG